MQDEHSKTSIVPTFMSGDRECEEIMKMGVN